MWSNGNLSREIVAKKVERIAELAGVNIPVGTRFMVVEETGYGKEFPFSGEKLSLVLIVCTVIAGIVAGFGYFYHFPADCPLPQNL